MASSMSNLHDSDFRPAGSSLLGTTAIVTAGPGSRPGSSLKTARSESNLRSDYLIKNISSTSLAAPPARFSATGNDAASRPGTVQSMRNSGSKKPSLEVNTAEVLTPTFGGPNKSPLGQYELASPVKSDLASFFGDEPEKIAQEITSRITREEEMAKVKIANEEKRRVQAELEAQRKRNMEASRPTMAYPSPPASIEGESEKPGPFTPGPKPSPRSQGGPFQERRPGPRGQGPMYGPAGRRPRPRPQVSTANNERPGSRGGRVSKLEGPSGRPPTASDAVQSGNMNLQKRDGNKSREAPGPQMLRPQATMEQARGATATAIKPPPRSPLFQQMNPFDVHSDEENDDKEPADSNTNVPAAPHSEDRRAPYGIPSPPLSHRQHPSDEQEEGMPIIRTVEAKRDTILVGGPGRTSLGLQIEEFERTLQQAQAMSALENKADPGAGFAANGTTRSRADSNGSSNYSEMSESPMTIEPPLVSPKPFPLSPRPRGPAVQSTTTPTDIVAPVGRPSLEARSERTFGTTRRQTDDSVQPARRPTLEDRSESPTDARLRPRMGAAAALRRPALEEYGKIKVNTTSALAGRVHRPSPDEYGPVRIKRTESPFRSESSFSIGSGTFRMDSPILKVVRHGIYQGSEDSIGSSSSANSAHTSRTNSPVPTGSYSVFSPPPSLQAPSAAASVVKHTATLPLLSNDLNASQPEWFGPAPTAPPTSPLPIPERNARRKDTFELATTPPQPALAEASPPSGLAASASIVPDIDANPNWPLPGPSSFIFPPPPVPSQQQHERQASNTNVESGFAARRSLLRDKRAPPAPLNIAATKYADEVDFGGAHAGLWTPDVPRPSTATSPSLEDRKIIPALSMLRPSTAGGLGSSSSSSSSMMMMTHNSAAAYAEATSPPNTMLLSDGEDKSQAIGVARGLSIRHDRIREQERRMGSRAAERMRQKQRAAAWRVDEDGNAGPSSPTTVEPFDRLRRPNYGLKSPTGIADEQGIRFI